MSVKRGIPCAMATTNIRRRIRMNSTAAVLRRIKDICTKQDTCRECPLDRMFCETTPEHWASEEIVDIADMIDDYEEEEE